jgi:hypothetical protein
MKLITAGTLRGAAARMRRRTESHQEVRWLSCAALGAAVLLAAAPASAGTSGLRTKFGEVRVRGLKIGQTYSMNNLLKLPLRLINTGDQAVDLAIEIVPVSSATQPGYEPLPDSSWLKLEKTLFTVDPGHEAVSDIIISIPNDAKLLGRRFEAHIWSKSRPHRGTFAAGIMSTLLIEVASVPPTDDELKKQFVDRQLANLDFTLFPSEGVAEDVPLGVDFDLKKERKLSIKLVNPNDAGIHFRIRSEPSWESLIPAPAGFQDPPSYGWVRPSTDTVTVAGNSIKDTALIINIPDDAQYRGQAFFFSIAVEVLEQEIPARAFYKLYVKTRSGPQPGK